MKLKPEEIELIIFPAKCPSKIFLEAYNQAYACWREVWDSFYKEMSTSEKLFSDTFSRQDEIITLFFRGECAALLFCREVDFSENATFHDSYFDIWPEEALKRLCKDGNKILLISQLSIREKFRKSYLGLSWRDLLVGLCYERFHPSDCHAAATSVRIQKRMDQSILKVNGTPLVHNLHYRFDQNVDLVGFFRDKIYPSTVPGIAQLANEVFSNRISLVDYEKNNIKKKVKSAA